MEMDHDDQQHLEEGGIIHTPVSQVGRPSYYAGRKQKIF